MHNCKTKYHKFINPTRGQIIVVFGALGKTGRKVVSQAKSVGFTVRETGRTDDPKQVLIGASAAVLVFGPRPPYTDIFCADKTKQIIKAMRQLGTKRLLCQTGAMIGDYPKNRKVFFALMSRLFQIMNPRGYADRQQQEEEIKKSGLDWTIIKPPKLTDGKNTFSVTAGTDVKIGLFSSVFRANLARFIVEELQTPHFIQKVIFVTS